jgi:hypothetical protein
MAEQAPPPLGYTTGERVAGLIGLAVLVALGLICLDLASGGRLAQFLEPAAAPGAAADGGGGE